VLTIERPALVPGDVAGPVTDHRTSGPDVLFRAFWDQVAGEKLSEEQSEAWADVLEQVLRDEREAGS